MGPPGRCSREFGMKWRVMLELVGPDGIVGVYEVGGRAAVSEYVPQMIGLTLEEGKHLLAALQVHLVQAQAEDHSRRRRRCQRCGAQRPLKDQRSRRLVSLFGTVEVRAPRFTPCRCAVTCRRTLNPVAEITPDRLQAFAMNTQLSWVALAVLMRFSRLSEKPSNARTASLSMLPIWQSPSPQAGAASSKS